MKSLAFWYEPINKLNSENKAELQLHLNHWKVKGESNNELDYFLDIGIRVKNGVNVQKLCFYLPEEILDLSTTIDDLGANLKNAKLLTAVFNENYSSNTVGNKKHFEVIHDGETQFYIYSLDIRSDCKPIHDYEGTIVKIPFTCFHGVDTYYRIRIKTDLVKNFSHIFRPKNSFFESISSSIELIDLRINDTRDLNLSLLEHIENNGVKFNISLIHLFIMRNITDDYILSDIKLNSVRLLEKDTWETYLQTANYEYNNSLAYHLKTKTSKEERDRDQFIEDFNALIKFRFEDSQLSRYLGYAILFALSTAIIGNILTRALQINLHTVKNFIQTLIHG
ncbi:hypothetical protein [Pontibacter beigongshangensis]|uniref:hypothetical protein n=1 Tax=Pontibacter beigongshangensis TaxID=2574733 RepID=UPI00164F2243|nr:hypothetical protein [Pontibacter beigongshangensis]